MVAKVRKYVGHVVTTQCDCELLQVNEKISNLGLYKKQKRQDWDHKAYHDTHQVLYIVHVTLFLHNI